MGNRVARTVGRYEILEELGRGGMATVFLARQADLDRLVALKELSAFRQADPAFTQRFLRESRLAGSLSHPNIVTVHDFFEYDGVPYIAMEYVTGGSLRPHIGHMSLSQVAGTLEGMLSALDHAEHHQIVHRDIKPENVLVTAQGRVKITDFGIAKATGNATTGSFLTATGTTVGTPNYMAPEQAMGQEVGPWTDLYSVGVMAFELFVGHVPFYDTEEPMAVLMRQVSDPIPPARSINPEVDDAISDWIERLVVKDPEKRVRSAREAWEEFEEIIIELVGPRWRRTAPLVVSSQRPADLPAGPHTPPPTTAARPPLMPTWEVPNWGPTTSEAPTRRLDDDGDAALAGTVMPDAPTRRLDDRDEAPERERGRRGKLLKVALVSLATIAVLAAAFGRPGSTPGGPSEAPTSTPVATVTGPDMSLQVPRGWRRVRPAPDVGLPLSNAVAAGPRGKAGGPVVEFGLVKGNRAANSTLLPAAFLSSTGQSSGSAPAHTAVRLPKQSLEAWRYTGLRPVGVARELTVYTVPTSAGVATVACAVPASQAASLAAQCDAIAGTLQLKKATRLSGRRERHVRDRPQRHDRRASADLKVPGSHPAGRTDPRRSGGRRERAGERIRRRRGAARGAAAEPGGQAGKRRAGHGTPCCCGGISEGSARGDRWRRGRVPHRKRGRSRRNDAGQLRAGGCGCCRVQVGGSKRELRQLLGRRASALGLERRLGRLERRFGRLKPGPAGERRGRLEVRRPERRLS